MQDTLGVTINGKHTLKDWGLHWSDCEISEPQPITKYVSIPGRKTKLDATESLFDSVTYENRTITLQLWKFEGWREWMQSASKIQNHIAGQLAKITLDIEPDRYWMGRGTVTSEHEAVGYGLTTYQIVFDVEPFKYFSEEPTDEWLWDPFSFEKGIIQNLRNKEIYGTTTVKVIAGEEPVVPVVTCTGQMTLDIPAVGEQPATSWVLKENIPKKLDGVLLYNAEYNFRFNGVGKATITFRGESL